jgi:hypothetical protein
MTERVEALPFKLWRDCIHNMIQTADFKCDENNSLILHSIRNKLIHFEDELSKLKEVTTILELALWKKRINDTNHQQNSARYQKKIKIDESSIRRQCCVTCGADVIIRHKLPCLITATDEESDSESDTNGVDGNESSDIE